MQIGKEDFDWFQKITGWLWGVLTTVSIGIIAIISWIIAKILQIKTHEEKITCLDIKINKLAETVEENKKSTDTKLTYISDFIQEDAKNRAAYAERREVFERTKSDEDNKRHLEMMEKLTRLDNKNDLIEDRNKRRQVLSQQILKDLKITNDKFDKAMSEVAEIKGSLKNV